jgi:hypothetical protein
MPRRNTMLALAALVLLAAPAVLFSQGTPAADFVGICERVDLASI